MNIHVEEIIKHSMEKDKQITEKDNLLIRIARMVLEDKTKIEITDTILEHLKTPRPFDYSISMYRISQLRELTTKDNSK